MVYHIEYRTRQRGHVLSPMATVGDSASSFINEPNIQGAVVEASRDLIVSNELKPGGLTNPAFEPRKGLWKPSCWSLCATYAPFGACLTGADTEPRAGDG